MGTIRYNKAEQEQLKQLPSVEKVTEKMLVFKQSFKREAVTKSKQGLTANQIFTQAGININKYAPKYFHHLLKRWKHNDLSDGVKQDRFKKAQHKDINEMSIEELKARIAYLEVENDFLKKTESLGTRCKYRRFALVSKAHQKGLSLKVLCKAADVSISGYYRWCQNHMHKQQKDAPDLHLIQEIFNKKHKKAGIRTIAMDLQTKYGIVINLKKIARIKKQYGLITKIRKKNPYNIIFKKGLEHRTAPNLLQRQFDVNVPDTVYSTDISYLIYNGGKRAYLSATKDLATKEIVAFNVCRDLSMQTAYLGLEETLKHKDCSKLIIHSDQGTHYTNPLYVNKLKELGVTQSMSRKGNCLDNAPIESFFGHLKDDLDIKSCKTFDEVKTLVENYIDYYNNERCQWNLSKMTPAQCRCHLLNAS